MTLPQIISRNQVQVPDGTVTVIGRVTNAATGIYVVPTGKVSRIASASMVLDATGADATYAVAINRGGTIIPLGQFIAVGGQSVASPPLILQAADIVTNVGDAGSTNGTCDQTVTFKEFDE